MVKLVSSFRTKTTTKDYIIDNEAHKTLHI